MFLSVKIHCTTYLAQTNLDVPKNNNHAITKCFHLMYVIERTTMGQPEASQKNPPRNAFNLITAKTLRIRAATL